VLVNTETGVKQTVTTGSDGGFTFAAVPFGQYELNVTMDGFNPTGRPPI
jgi:Carboxypeptidase regulatory-like domain